MRVGNLMRACALKPVRAACLLLALAAGNAGAQAEPVAVRPVHIPPASDSSADSAAMAQQSPPPPNCWRAQPSPPCPGFFITEFGLEVPVWTTRRRDFSAAGRARGDGTRRDFGLRPVWTFGFMGTKGPNSHGGTLSLTGDEQLGEAIQVTVEYRYRRWLQRAMALDGALGYRATKTWKDSVGLVPAKGLTAMAGFTPNRYVGVLVRADLVRGGGRTTRGLGVGITSQWVSERFIQVVAIGLLREALRAIGLEVEE